MREEEDTIVLEVDEHEPSDIVLRVGGRTMYLAASTLLRAAELARERGAVTILDHEFAVHPIRFANTVELWIASYLIGSAAAREARREPSTGKRL